MGIIILPTNVRLPTRLELAREDYVNGRIDVEELEARAWKLLCDGTADDADTPFDGMAMEKTWR